VCGKQSAAGGALCARVGMACTQCLPSFCLGRRPFLSWPRSLWLGHRFFVLATIPFCLGHRPSLSFFRASPILVFVYVDRSLALSASVSASPSRSPSLSPSLSLLLCFSVRLSAHAGVGMSTQVIFAERAVCECAPESSAMMNSISLNMWVTKGQN